MQRVQSEFAFRWNERHGRCGHVFQGRYGAKRAKDETQFLQAVRYVALNPVEAGHCERPEQWPWSSHRLVLARRTPGWFDDRRLMELLSSRGGDPLERFAGLTRRD